MNGDHEEIDYQRAIAAATSTANAQTAVEGASILGLVGGSAITSGTWTVKLGERVTGLGRIAASGPGAPIAVLVMGMMPGRLNDREQDDSLRSPCGSLPRATLSHCVRLEPAAGSHPERLGIERQKRKKHPRGAFLLNLVGRAG